MPLPFRIDDLEKIDEAQRGLYVEHGDGWKLDVELGDQDDSGKLKKALEAQRAEAKAERQKRHAIEERLNAFGDVDPDRVKALLEAEEKKTVDGLKDEGKLSELLDKRDATHAKKLAEAIEPRDQRISWLEQMLTTTLVDNALHASINGKVADGLRRGAMALLRDKIEVRGINGGDDGDAPKAVVVQDDDVLEVGKYVDIWLATEEGSGYAKARGDAGGGAPGSGQRGMNGATENPWKTNNLTEQMRITRADRRRATALAAEAGKVLPAPL